MDNTRDLHTLSEYELFEELGNQLKREYSGSFYGICGAIYSPSDMIESLMCFCGSARKKLKNSYQLGIEWFNDIVPQIKETVCIHPLTKSLASENICTQEVIVAIVEVIRLKNDVSVEIATICAFIIINRGINVFCKDYY